MNISICLFLTTHIIKTTTLLHHHHPFVSSFLQNIYTKTRKASAHLSITHVHQGCVVLGFKQLKVEELAIEELPGTDEVPRHGGPTYIVSKVGNFNPRHEESSQGNATRVH